MTYYRMDSESDWSAVRACLRSASPLVLTRCVDIIRERALEFLSEAASEGVAEVQSDLARGPEGWERIKAVAEAADDKYLDAGVEVEDLPVGDPAHDRVDALFRIARALAALVFASDPDVSWAGLERAACEGAYELAAALSERAGTLREELAGVCSVGGVSR